ncbi:uncharacterized protein N7469_009710 [Penicillium citrinum]|uniref:Uncharacterized protein n=1 Tax=Penicillium citrinum TaxID=5077 RepID=A0A9W9NLG2_PENCI|nr:uncharacterized protein N7469_009710 [Penicillium citrinum]KAJ5220823.1 hypothetical protein N7469_009710 [Penicillium citrinum]
MIQLQKQTLILKNLLKQQSNSSSNQIIKDYCIALHNTALLAQKNVNLYTANKKVVKKYTRSTKQILCKEDLTVEESLQLIAQLDLPAEAPAIDFYTQSKLSIQPDQLATRAPPRCSGYREIGHRISSYKNRYI